MKSSLVRSAAALAAVMSLALAPGIASASPAASSQASSTALATTVPDASRVMAPATPEHWSYSFKYDLGRTKASTAKKRLHDCFNCNFPVKGAPKKFPVKGQDLPLRAGPFLIGDFHCKFREEHSGHDQGGDNFGFTFDSVYPHIDGKGAWIAFNFQSGSTTNYLNVFGYVAKNTAIPESVYKRNANKMWSKFADKMRT